MTPGKPFALLVPALLAFVSSAAPALAGTFQVTPTRIELTPHDRTAVLALRNTGAGTLRFQLRAFRWDQRDSGEMVLIETEDVVVYPTLLSLPAGRARNIRVGVVARPGDLEKSYRIFVEELPPLGDRDRGGEVGIRVLTRMGIPVFLSPRQPRVDMRIGALSARGGRVSFAVENPGSTHVKVGRVHVEARSANGEPILQRDLPGWYILAGGRLDFGIDLSTEVCPSVAEVRVHAIAQSTRIRRSFRLDSLSCAR